MSLTGVAFVLAYGYGLLKAFMTHPRWGFYTYVATFYLHPPMRWWGQGLPDLRWSLTSAIITLLAMPSGKLPVNATPWTSHALPKIAILYVTWMWIQLGWATERHLDGVILMTKYVILFYLIYRLIRDVEGVVQFAFAHVIGCLYFGLLALGAKGGGRLENIGGPGVSDSNTLGMHMATGLLFAGALILSQRGWRRWAVMAMVPIIANGFVQTQSRGAFLGAACGGLLFYLYSPKHYRKFIVTLGTMSIFILLAYAPAEYWQRISTIGNATGAKENIDGSAMSRLFIAKAQWQMFLDHPFGLGFDTTTHLSRQYLAAKWLSANAGPMAGRASHNTMMSVLTDQGIPGILLAACGLVATLAAMRRVGRRLARHPDGTLRLMTGAICGALATSFVAGMFANYLKAEIQLWCLTLLIVVQELSREPLPAPAAETYARDARGTAQSLTAPSPAALAAPAPPTSR